MKILCTILYRGQNADATLWDFQPLWSTGEDKQIQKTVSMTAKLTVLLGFHKWCTDEVCYRASQEKSLSLRKPGHIDEHHRREHREERNELQWLILS